MSRSDRIAVLISLLAILAGYLVNERIFENLAHIEDEIAYIWQARAIAGGQLTLPTPPEPKSFLVPFVVDHNGERFGKYPLGWPVLLSIGEKLGVRSLVNPLLAGLGVWLTYLLGKRIFSEIVGLLAAGLTLTSPFFLMNSGSLLSHPLGLVLSAAFALSWMDAFYSDRSPPGWLPMLTAACSLGLLALTRPLTAAAIAIPFGLHGLYLLIRKDWATRRRLILFGLIVLFISSLHFLWQYAVTGDPTLNPYTLWWDYDTIGFGPGHGHSSTGHTLEQARINTRHSLRVGWKDLFGWLKYSWIFLPIGLLSLFRNRGSWLLGSVFPMLVLVYSAYWIGSSLFGPRYFYEGLFSLTLFSASGIALLAGWPTRPGETIQKRGGWQRARPLAVTFILAILVSANLLFYTPIRLNGMNGLYKIQRSYLEPFQTTDAQELTPALIIVHPSKKWIEYGRFLELSDPFMSGEFIFVYSRGAITDAIIVKHFPDRNVYHYYQDEPNRFYTGRRP